MIDNHARVIVLLIDSSQIDNDFMATIASFATHTYTNQRKFYKSWCSVYTKFDLRTSIPHSVPRSCVPAFTVTLISEWLLISGEKMYYNWGEPEQAPH